MIRHFLFRLFVLTRPFVLISFFVLTSLFVLTSFFVLLCPLDLNAQPSTRITVDGQEVWLNGTNVAWVNFARDLGPGGAALSEFELAFKGMYENGGNTMRLWLHTTGAHTPEWSGEMVVGPGANAIENLEAILDLAEQYDVMLLLSLWSFDMLRASNNSTVLNRSHAILTQQENRTSYLENSLKPMVQALKDHPAILAWEIFNEAEGMSQEFGWSITTQHVPMSDIQAFVNQCAGAIKEIDSDAKVTTGIVTFNQVTDIYASTNPLYKNYYRNDRLIAAGGHPGGILDFYTVHYYGHSESPFEKPVTYFEVDKPLALAEFFIQGSQGDVGVEEYYQRLYNNGYAGALSWQWVDWRQNRNGNEATWLNTLPNMRTLYNQARDEVDVSLTDRPLWYEFTISEQEIEEGFPVTVTWKSRQTQSVTLNGETVPPFGSMTFIADESMDYLLALEDEAGNLTEETFSVTVIPADEVDRTEGAEVITAPDGKKLVYDLKSAYDVLGISLDFEERPENVYKIERSFDALNWETVVTVTDQTDTYEFDEPWSARFVRIESSFPFVMGDADLFGTLSEQQPPTVNVLEPLSGKVIQEGAEVEILVEGLEGTGEFSGLYFHINGEEVHWRRFRPFTYSHTFEEPGVYTIQGEVRDSQFGDFFSRPVTVTVLEAGEITRYEAEDATLTGATVVQSDAEASEGEYVKMDGSGAVTWPNVVVTQAGTYTLKFGFNLPFDYKEQKLSVNGAVVDTLIFEPPTSTWQLLEQDVVLQEGSNAISIEHYWGYMWFDYMELFGEGVGTSVLPEQELPVAHALGVNYPNPFNPATLIPYEISRPAEVTLEILDLLGRRVKLWSMGTQSAGTYEVRFDAGGLSSGVYIYRLQAGEQVFSRKMMLLK